jgi:hypothetical protein
MLGGTAQADLHRYIYSGCEFYRDLAARRTRTFFASLVLSLYRLASGHSDMSGNANQHVVASRAPGGHLCSLYHSTAG